MTPTAIAILSMAESGSKAGSANRLKEIRFRQRKLLYGNGQPIANWLTGDNREQRFGILLCFLRLLLLNSFVFNPCFFCVRSVADLELVAAKGRPVGFLRRATRVCWPNATLRQSPTKIRRPRKDANRSNTTDLWQSAIFDCVGPPVASHHSIPDDGPIQCARICRDNENAVSSRVLEPHLIPAGAERQNAPLGRAS